MINATGEARSRRIEALDGLRGLAALAVVAYHYGNRIAHIYPEVGKPIPILVYGQYGVHLFFVISGFVIYLTVQNATPRRFIIGRLIRLYPTYWVCILVTLAVVAVAGLPGREVSRTEVLINFTMLQTYFGVPSVDGAYWTLAAELGFYVQLGTLFFIGALGEKRLLIGLYLWLASALVGGEMHRFAIAPLLRKAFASLSVGCYWIPLFIAGIAFFHIWRGDRRPPMLSLPACAVAAMMVHGVSTGVAALCVFGLFAAVLWGPHFRRMSRPLAFLGAISYPLYLIHQNVGYVAIRWLRASGVGQSVALVTAVFAIILLAALLTKYVDIPIRKALRLRLLPKHAKGRSRAGISQA